MPSTCYRCGAPVEEQTPFCAACGAPQIKVTVPAAPANEPSSSPLPPGTPDSIQPPAVPVSFLPPGQIQWKKYGRVAVPLSVLAGISIAVIAPLGLLIFFGGIVYSVNRYRREHPGHLRASQGALLGALNGLISFLVSAALLFMLTDRDEYRRQTILEFQKRLAGNPDPNIQQLIHWVATPQGFLFIMLLGFVLLLIIFLIVSSLAGALTVTLSGNKGNR